MLRIWKSFWIAVGASCLVPIFIWTFPYSLYFVAGVFFFGLVWTAAYLGLGDANHD